MRRVGLAVATAALSAGWLGTLMLATPRSTPPAVATTSPSASETPSASPSASPTDSPSPSPSPSPTGPSSFTIAASPPVAVWGTTFTISGTLVCFGQPVAGAGITVQKRVGGTFVFASVGQSTTGAAGEYSITHRPDRSADYRALVPGGTGSCGLSTSPLARADVRPGVAANPSSARPPRGAAVEFRGVVAPGHPGLRVYLQVFQGRTGTWANSTVAALDASSRFRLAYRRTSPGFLLFRVVFPTQDRDHVWNISRNLRVDWT